jgi:hypothetical protein
MKVNCPYCTKEIEFLIKNNANGIPNMVSKDVQRVQPLSVVSSTGTNTIISRGAPIQSQGTIYYKDNNTGQIFTQPNQGQIHIPNGSQANTQTQLSVGNENKVTSSYIQESVKANVVNNPNAVDTDTIKSVAFGTPKPGNVANEQKQKEAEMMLSRLASSDGKI